MTRLPNKQADALDALQRALSAATATGLLDILILECEDPDSINDVCDTVDELIRETA